MQMFFPVTYLTAAVAGGLMLFAASNAALGAPKETGISKVGVQVAQNDHWRRAERDRHDGRKTGRAGHHSKTPVHHGRKAAHRRSHKRHFRNVVIFRPHGHGYRGYGKFRRDDQAYKWLAFTAITLKALDVLNEEQQRAHEAAQVRATRARVGETIAWREGRARGSVTAIREGETTSGRYCREFQQEVKVGAKTERAYGTACRQPDGAWEIVSTRS